MLYPRRLAFGLAVCTAGSAAHCSNLDPTLDVEAAELRQAGNPECPADRETTACGVMFERIVAGSAHTCGVLAESKRISCWGQSSGMADWPRELAFRSVSTGPYFSCGARASDGRVQCWGWVKPVDHEGDFTEVSVGGQVVCALRTPDGDAECWSTGGTTTGASGDGGFTEIAISESTACAIRRADGTMRCWGFGYDDVVVPPNVHAPPGGFKALAAAEHFFCAIRTDTNEVVCWGPEPPLDPPAGVAFDGFAITSYGSGCGIRADDHTIQCWYSRVLERGTPSGIAFKGIAISGEIRARMEQGRYLPDPLTHACALRADNDQLYCWGDDRVGQVSGAPNRVAYEEVVSHTPTPDLSSRRVCARRTDNGHAVCVGEGPKLPSDVPFKQITAWCGIRADDGRLLCSEGIDVAAPPDLAFARIAQRNDLLCGLRADTGDLVCFGSDSEPIVRDAPSNVRFTQLSVGQNQACGLRAEDGRAQCWGSVDGVAPDLALKQVVIAQEGDLACGLRADNGFISCWGSGQSWAPIDVAFSRLSEGAGCGIRADNGQAMCWSGGYGYLYLPSDLAFRDLAAGFDGACGIVASDGRLTCWGSSIWNLY